MITQTSLQTIWALVNLAEAPAGKFTGASAVARKIGARPNYLSKLLQLLARDGLLESQKGLRGGFRLARDPAEITLLEVVDPIDNVSRWAGCILGLKECSEEQPCIAHHRWIPVKEAYVRLLSELTIADLVDHDRRVVLNREEASDD